MRKFLHSSLFLVALVALTFCRGNSDVGLSTQKYRNGIIFVNEGNFSQANGSLAFYNNSNGAITGDIIKTENNGTGINATIQKVFDDAGTQKICVVTNAPDKFMIFNGTSFKYEGEVNSGLTNPFSVAVSGGKAYVSEWGANPYVAPKYSNAKIQIIDINTRQITSSITVGKEIYGMLELGGKIYAAVTGEDKIWVINPSNGNSVTYISTTSARPAAMEVDANGKIWVLCSSGKIDIINPTTATVEKTITGVSVAGYGSGEKIVMNPNRTMAYWLGSTSAGFTGGGVFRLSATTPYSDSAPTSPFVAGTKFYGIGVNASQIVLGVTDYASTQEVHFYSQNGAFGGSVAANGYLPNGFLFR